LNGVLEVFDLFPGYILCLSWIYFIDIQNIFDWCPGDNVCVPKIFEGVLEIFDGFAGDIRWVSWRYLTGFLEIFKRSPGDI